MAMSCRLRSHYGETGQSFRVDLGGGAAYHTYPEVP